MCRLCRGVVLLVLQGKWEKGTPSIIPIFSAVPVFPPLLP